MNHQWSKSLRVRRAAARRGRTSGSTRPELLQRPARPRSELWVARGVRSAAAYFDTFMSCNRAFRQDPATRATTWCGECDKCLFIDLVLAPFVDRARLEALFGGREPIGDPARIHDLEVLVGSPTTPSRSSASATPTSARRPSSPSRRARIAPTSPTSRRSPLGAAARRRSTSRAGHRGPTDSPGAGMRHEISFSDLAGRRVGVFGLGVEGRAALARGSSRSAATSSSSTTTLPSTGATWRARDRRRAAPPRCRSCDAVIKSPGISRYRDDVAELCTPACRCSAASGCGSRRRTGLGSICVTGTKGKSTVTTVIGAPRARARNARGRRRQPRRTAVRAGGGQPTVSSSSSRPRASRRPTSRTRRASLRSPPSATTTSTGTGAPSATTPTSSR